MRKDSVSPVMIITTSSTGNAQLTGSKDLVGLYSMSGEVLMTASEFEQLAQRYAAWKDSDDTTTIPAPNAGVGSSAYCGAE